MFIFLGDASPHASETHMPRDWLGFVALRARRHCIASTRSDRCYLSEKELACVGVVRLRTGCAPCLLSAVCLSVYVCLQGVFFFSHVDFCCNALIRINAAQSVSSHNDRASRIVQ